MEIELVKMLNDGNMSFSEIAEALNIKRDIVVDYAIQYDL
jgi:DNA-binding CsgD family transcriptional regulator